MLTNDLIFSSISPIIETVVPNNDTSDPKTDANESEMKTNKNYRTPYSGIGEALFPKTRRKVLSLFMLNPDKQYYFREATKLIGASTGAVKREFDSLQKSGILISRKIGIHIFYQANRENPIYDELKSIVEKTFGIVDILRDTLRSYEDKIELALIHGSIATGKDTASSDIDLLIVTELGFREIVKILGPIEEIMKRPINPSVYSLKEFNNKYTSDNHFIKSVFESEIIYLIGSINESTGMV